MKKYIIIFLCIMNQLTYNALAYPNFKQLLITKNNQPTAPLIALLDICGIAHDGSLESIIAATQKDQPIGFLRPSNKERWQVTSYLSQQRESIIAQCKKLEMFTEIAPTKSLYDYVIVFGGIIERFRSRITFLKQLWHMGIRWNHLVILTGHRVLDPVIESSATWYSSDFLSIKPDWQLKNPPVTETDMIRMVLEQSIVPEAWESITTTIVNTPMQLKQSGLERPNTGDTVYHWLSTNPKPGSILAISAQPLIGYQDAVLHRIIPSSFNIQTVGAAINPESIEPEILIGTVGWWLFNAYQSH